LLSGGWYQRQQNGSTPNTSVERAARERRVRRSDCGYAAHAKRYMSQEMKIPLSLPALALLSACSGELCGNDPLTAEESPDKKHVAMVFLRDCGATTGFSTQVSILDAPGKLQNQPGNILVVEGKHPCSVRWEGNNKLVISGLDSAKEFLKLAEYKGIEIKYEK
jgi:hypothetical protein